MTVSPNGAMSRTWVVVRDPSSVKLTRNRVVDLLARWEIGLPDELDYDIRLVISELVTNAVRHDTSDHPVLTTKMVIAPDRSELYFEVLDGTPPEPPAPRQSRDRDEEELATGGRGLLLVSVKSKRWGIDPAEHGKRVWVVFELPKAPSLPERVRQTLRAHIRAATPRPRIRALAVA